MTVSMALIVKNEEQTLDRCLASLAGAVDEIVVVDTGSTDATADVARRYTNRVFDFPWRQDFALARQFAFEQTRGDWAGWVDADDVVVGAEHIRRLAAEAPADVGAIYWRYTMDFDAAGQPQCQFWRERLVRNDGSYRWQGRIHEVLASDRPWQTARAREVWVEHRSPAGRDAARLQRNIALLEAELADSGATPSPRLLFYLGRDYASAGRSGDALATYQRYLAMAAAVWDEERYLAHVAVAGLLRSLNRLDEAIDADLQAIKLLPRWPDAYFGLAQTAYLRALRDDSQGRWSDVVHWCDIGRSLPTPETDHILDLAASQHRWMIHYTNALYHLGRPGEALAWTEQALTLCPDDPWHRHNALFFAEIVGR
jgi:glycosyltransferase involved in cell wall biosynthesis